MTITKQGMKFTKHTVTNLREPPEYMDLLGLNGFEVDRTLISQIAMIGRQLRGDC